MVLHSFEKDMLLYWSHMKYKKTLRELREKCISFLYIERGEDGIVKYDGKNILFLIFFLIEKLGISPRL